MGDRGNILVKDNDADSGVYLYTHWGGSDLAETLKNALKRGKGRWTDGPYLTRIIFCEMIEGDVNGETGYGISTSEMDPENPTITVNCHRQVVSTRDGGFSFTEYIADKCESCGRS